MRGVRRILALAILLAAPAANACSGEYPPEQWRQFRIDQDRRERAYIAEVTRDADRIFVGKLVRSEKAEDKPEDASLLGAGFRVERTYKGHHAETVNVRWRLATKAAMEAGLAGKPSTVARADDTAVVDTIEMSCWPSDKFDWVDFDGAEGYRYLVYVRDGLVLRASRFNEGPAYIQAQDEADLLPALTH